MIHQHLQGSAMVAPPTAIAPHLDEDALNAFVEGRLNERESAPIIKHLVACSYCRHATSQLVRLDSEIGIAQTPIAPPSTAEEPGRIRRLLDDLASRVLPSSDEDTVFAYHAPAEDFQRRDEAGANDASSGEEEDEPPKESDSTPKV
jgi:hypothetical protein